MIFIVIFCYLLRALRYLHDYCIEHQFSTCQKGDPVQSQQIHREFRIRSIVRYSVARRSKTKNFVQIRSSVLFNIGPIERS